MADEHKTDLKGRLTAALPDGLFRRSIASPGRDSVPKDTLTASPAGQPRTVSPGRTLPRGFGGTVGKKDLEKMSAQERQRQEVIFEIIDTERQYVNDLKLLVEKLLHPAIEKGVLTKEDAGHLCLNVERLLELNADLLKDLDALQAKDIIIAGIGPTLLTRCDHLKLYAVYCAHYKQATYEEMRARLPKFAAFVDEVLKGDEWRGVPLTAYLHKPIARICKYPLLLRELLKQTPESLADHAPLTEAHARICAVVDRINERTRQVEAMQRLDEIEKSLDGAKDIMLAQLTRRFVREVNCKEAAKKDDMHLFLFNDLLILARPRSKKGRFELKRHSPLHLMTCSDVAGDAKALELVWQDGAHDVVEFATAEEHAAWRTELMNLITSCKEDLKKRPPVPLVANTTNDRASGRGKLTRTTSDGHLKNQAMLKSSGEMKEAAKIGAAELAPPVQASPKDRKVPVLMVGTPMLVASEPSPKHTDGTTPGRARHLIDLEKLAGRSAESPRSARRSTIAESPRKGKDYASMSKEELLKEVQALHTDKEMMQASLAQLKGDMARVAVGLREEVTSLRERLVAAEKERDEARAALASKR